MELLADLREAFRLDSVKLNTITRKSLLKWSRDVLFEERRQKFYGAACSGKLKSRVSICQKKGKRPDWSIRLEMLKTPKIRTAIKIFLDDLGVYTMPKKKNLGALATEKHWKQVLFLDDEALKDYDDDKRGGVVDMPQPAKEKKGTRRRPPPESSSSAPTKPSRKRPANWRSKEVIAAEKLAKDLKKRKKAAKALGIPDIEAPNSPVPSPQRSSLRRRRGHRGSMVSPAPQRQRVNFADRHQDIPPGHQVFRDLNTMERRTRENAAVIDSVVRDRERVSRERANERIAKVERGMNDFIKQEEGLGLGKGAQQMQATRNRSRELHRRKRLRRAGVIDLTLEGEDTEEKIDLLAEKAIELKEELDKKKDEIQTVDPGIPMGTAMGDDEKEFPTSDGFSERRCYLIDDKEEIDCLPVPLSNLRMGKKDQKKILSLSVARKEACERIHLLRLKYEEFRWQKLVWSEFQKNNRGDFLSSFSKDRVNQLARCKKDNKTVFNSLDLNTMKSVAHCFGISQDLCKAFTETEQRFSDKKVLISKSYTLGNISDDDLVRKWNQNQDDWTKTALKNRVRNEDKDKQIYCEPVTGGKPTQISISKIDRLQRDCPQGNCVGLPLTTGTIATLPAAQRQIVQQTATQAPTRQLFSGGGSTFVPQVTPPQRQLFPRSDSFQAHQPNRQLFPGYNVDFLPHPQPGPPPGGGVLPPLQLEIVTC